MKMMRRKMMIKLKLKRKMSGRAIKKKKREQELYVFSEYICPVTGEKSTYKRPKHRKDYSYNKNSPQKRHVENPNVYEGEFPVIGGGVKQIRLPKKKRRTAWKRFKKNFPYIEITKAGGKEFNHEKYLKFLNGKSESN
jgi:hypothetical protein